MASPLVSPGSCCWNVIGSTVALESTGRQKSSIVDFVASPDSITESSS
jgi:hypothetical protein